MIADNQDLAEFAALLKAGFNESDWERYTDSFPLQVSPFPEISDDVWRVAFAWNFDEETTFCGCSGLCRLCIIPRLWTCLN